MENIIMHTPQDVIKAFLGLPEKGREEVRNFVISTNGDVAFLVKAFDEDYVREENYSPDTMAKIDRDAEEAKKGINVSGPFEGQAAIDFLTEIEKQNQA